MEPHLHWCKCAPISFFEVNQILINRCGSSSVLPPLISREAATDPDIREEYPLVKEYAPDFNETKFRSFPLIGNCESKDTWHQTLAGLLPSIHHVTNELS